MYGCCYGQTVSPCGIQASFKMRLAQELTVVMTSRMPNTLLLTQSLVSLSFYYFNSDGNHIATPAPVTKQHGLAQSCNEQPNQDNFQGKACSS